MKGALHNTWFFIRAGRCTWCDSPLKLFVILLSHFNCITNTCECFLYMNKDRQPPCITTKRLCFLMTYWRLLKSFEKSVIHEMSPPKREVKINHELVVLFPWYIHIYFIKRRETAWSTQEIINYIPCKWWKC